MNTAIWAWVGIIVLISAYVVGYDVWAQVTNHVTMSAQFHTWMQSELVGPIVVAIWMGASIGLAYHFLINK